MNERINEWLKEKEKKVKLDNRATFANQETVQRVNSASSAGEI